MPKYIIERNMPGAGNLSGAELRGISQKSCSVLRSLGPEIRWIESYVTDDKIYCVYFAPNEECYHMTKERWPWWESRESDFPLPLVERHPMFDEMCSVAWGSASLFPRCLSPSSA